MYAEPSSPLGLSGIPPIAPQRECSARDRRRSVSKMSFDTDLNWLRMPQAPISYSQAPHGFTSARDTATAATRRLSLIHI